MLRFLRLRHRSFGSFFRCHYLAPDPSTPRAGSLPFPSPLWYNALVSERQSAVIRSSLLHVWPLRSSRCPRRQAAGKAAGHGLWRTPTQAAGGGGGEDKRKQEHASGDLV